MAVQPRQQTRYHISRLQRGELAVVHAITKMCFDLPYTMDTLRDYRRRAGAGFLVARSGSDIVGFAVLTTPVFPLSLFLRAGELVLIAVSPSHQGQGLGQHLLDASFEYLRGEGMRQVRLHVDVCNSPAIALYERNGMGPTHVVPRYYRNGRDAYRMVGPL